MVSLGSAQFSDPARDPKRVEDNVFVLCTLTGVPWEIRSLAITWTFSCLSLQGLSKKSDHGWPGATGKRVTGWRPRLFKKDQLGVDLKEVSDPGEAVSAANTSLPPGSWEPLPWSSKIDQRKSQGLCSHLENRILF